MQQVDLQALLNRRAQLLAQEQAAMEPAQNLGLPQAPPAMSQAQFSGYGQPKYTPQQLLQLQTLLRDRQ